MIEEKYDKMEGCGCEQSALMKRKQFFTDYGAQQTKIQGWQNFLFDILIKTCSIQEIRMFA